MTESQLNLDQIHESSNVIKEGLGRVSDKQPWLVQVLPVFLLGLAIILLQSFWMWHAMDQEERIIANQQLILHNQKLADEAVKELREIRKEMNVPVPERTPVKEKKG